MGKNFRQKARFVADGHKIEAPSSITYITVVSRDYVRICLTIAALNKLGVLTAYVENDYLSSQCRERVWLHAGPEFGNRDEKVLILRQALYGLKFYGAAFQAFIEDKSDDTGFKSSIADPDVLRRPATNLTRKKYYEYILFCVDYLIFISQDTRKSTNNIQSTLKFRNDKVEEPDFYLEEKLAKREING